MRQVAKENSQMFGSEDLKTVAAQHLYALMLFSQGRYEKAAKKQERLMTILEEKYGKHDGNKFEVAGALVQRWLAQGKLNRSKALAIKRLRRNERKFRKR